MPSVFIPVAPFPNVPFLPGVPQLARSALFQPATTVTLGQNATTQQLALAAQTAPVWGVFDSNNNRVITPDNIYAFSDRAEWRVLDYPVQEGAFSSFNKVVVPFEDTLRFIKGGSLSARTAFLKQIDNIAGDTNLYTIVTPEKSYLNVNILKRELIRRSSEGAFFLEVDVYFRQINQVAAQYSTTAANTSNAADPASLPTVNQGNVQLVPLTSAQSSTSAQAANAIAQAPF